MLTESIILDIGIYMSVVTNCALCWIIVDMVQ